MKVVIAGGSGFLGRRLADTWRHGGHEVTVLTRTPRQPGDMAWSPAAPGPWTMQVGQADAVVNLAGEGIADQRWTTARRAAIFDSRAEATRALARALRDGRRGVTFLSASAIGFYGTGERPAGEDSPAGDDFLARVCVAWEAEANAAADAGRVVLLRTGVVLARDGGALPRMALPFRFFAGGRVGSGRQPVSWIHVDDWVSMATWALTNAAVAGPLNLTAPAPVTNAEFTRALARAMRRPAVLPVPAFALRVALGRELADSLLLNGRRVLPVTAQRLGFTFTFPTIDAALTSLFQ